MSIESSGENRQEEALPEWAQALKEHLAQLKTDFSRKKLKEKLGTNSNLKEIEMIEDAYARGKISERQSLEDIRDFLDNIGYWEKKLHDKENPALVDQIFQDKIEEEKHERGD